MMREDSENYSRKQGRFRTIVQKKLKKKLRTIEVNPLI